MELKDKICLITGGTKGIGAATALLFARLGARVAVVGRNLKDAEAVQTEKRLADVNARFIQITGDMARADDCLACVQRTQKEMGDIDVLVHSAGGPVPGGLLEITPQSWHAAFDVHVHAIFHLCRAVVPAMKKRREGAIVLISTAGRRAIKTNIAYQVVKGAVPQITRALAYELADDNIRVNCVAPGVIRTAFHDAMTPAVKENNLKNRIPLHREGIPNQVASLIREMTQNDYITGETYTIDGGLTMRIC